MRKFGLLGKNISYSFSRGYFSEKFKALELSDCTYENFDLDEISKFPELIAQNPSLAGLNVTIPYKEAVIPFLERLDPVAREIGAVNTICFRPEGLTGYNTDVIGFRDSLRPFLKEADRNALILGTGGASKAVAHALQQMGIDFRFVSRKEGTGRITYEDLDSSMIESVQLFINCTPLGTFPKIGAAPDIPYEHLHTGHLLFDLIYNPPLTTFLKTGQAKGCRVVNGHRMLEIQAEASWELWNRP